MNKNYGIKMLSGSVALVVFLILFNNKSTTNVKEDQIHTNNFNEAIASQFNDNIRDVSARLQQTEKRLEAMQKQNKLLRHALQQPKQVESTNIKQQLQTLQEKIASIVKSESSSYPIEDKNQLTQIKDLDALLEQPTGESDPLDIWNKQDAKHKVKTVEPFYTIPAGSDFERVTLLSALVGEVPVEGKLMQPLFPFSAMISRGDLMTANGMQLPTEIIGMKVSGYSLGVGSFLDNISCVRAYVTAALFVFDDGHFVTVGQEKMKGSAEMINNDSLGYLTSQHGNPCIKGNYISNAPQVLTSFMAAGGIQGASSALSKWQMTYQSEGGGTTATPTGQIGHFAAGGALSEGSQKVTDWMEKRVQGSFDMVFVPASLKVHNQFVANQLSLHFNQTIAIDKTINGRVLDYGHQTQQHLDNALR